MRCPESHPIARWQSDQKRPRNIFDEVWHANATTANPRNLSERTQLVKVVPVEDHERSRLVRELDGSVTLEAHRLHVL